MTAKPFSLSRVKYLHVTLKNPQKLKFKLLVSFDRNSCVHILNFKLNWIYSFDWQNLHFVSSRVYLLKETKWFDMNRL